MSGAVGLWPVEEGDLANLVRLLWDRVASGEFQWFGFRMAEAHELEQRWRADGLIGNERSFLAVGLEDGSCAGWVGWRKRGEFGRYEIGVALFPEDRGHGIGTEAQRQLVDYLFRTTTGYRLEARTEIENLAEQKSLEKVGFQREGVLRGLYFRDGSWRDSVIYGLLRADR
jgi:RimJ/RimL family protein N-acetyltransferase